MLFSELNQAFYDPRANYGDGAPADLIKINDDQYLKFYESINNNKRIYTSNGELLVSDQRPDKYHSWDSQKNEWVIDDDQLNQKHQDIIDSLKMKALSEVIRAGTQISIISDRIELDDYSSEEDKANLSSSLIAWKKYRIACNNVSNGTSTELPSPPDA
ncbi:tail fiber assembly protein [Rosenbergiella epipactidis]|uniref:tail fiber assembly protein n=1 Tax=Rosenbergiella epipactidis TaxID=1544694 RepID=UPI001F4D9CD8|nr:tail fiber assembly protein [Rosenbergiella epipactidis]